MFGNLSLAQGKLSDRFTRFGNQGASNGNFSSAQGKLAHRFTRFGNQGANNVEHFGQDRSRPVSFGAGSNFGGMGSNYPADNFLHDDYMDNNLYGDRRSIGGRSANEGRALVRYDDNVFGESRGRRVSFGGRPANEGRALMRYDGNMYEDNRSRRAPRRTPPQRRSHAEDQVFYKLVPVPISSGNRTRRRSRSVHRDKGRNYGRRDISRSSRPSMVRQRYSGRRSSPPNNTYRRSPIGRINRRSNTNNGIYGRNSSGPAKKKHMTPEELDKELEAYMKSSKHPRVELY